MGQPDNKQLNQQTGQPGGQSGSPQQSGQPGGKESNQQEKQGGEQTPEFDETRNRQDGTADQTDVSWRPGERPVGQDADTEGDLGGGQGDQQRSAGAGGTNE